MARGEEHPARSDAGRKLPHVHRHSRRVRACNIHGRERTGHRGLRRSVRGAALLSGGRVFPGIRYGQIAQIHFRAHGHPSGQRKRTAGRKDDHGGSLRGAGGRDHSGQSRRKSAPRRHGDKGRKLPRHTRSHGRIPAARSRGRRLRRERLGERHVAHRNARGQSVLRLHGVKDPRPRGKRRGTKVESRKLHHQIRTLVHADRCRGGGFARGNSRRGDGRLERLDLPRAQFPRRILSLRAGHLRAALLLRRHRRGVAAGNTGQGLELSRKIQQSRRVRIRQDGHAHKRQFRRHEGVPRIAEGKDPRPRRRG